MSERASTLRAWVRAATALALVASPPVGAAQAEPTEKLELPSITGRVVRESDGSPVVDALVEANLRSRGSVAHSDDAGRFALEAAAPKCFQSNATNTNPYDYVDYLKISAPGIARTLVDPCADAPWAQPIRLRPSASLTGRFDRAPADPECQVVLTAPWQDLCWPPRTGLTSSGQQWTAPVDEQGRFEIRDVPSQVPLTVRLERKDTRHGIELARDLVLAPSEQRELEFVLPEGPLPLQQSPARDPTATWIPVDASLTSSETRSVNLPAFEIVDGGQFQPHRVGGGRWHVHGWRACNHLEALPGTRTLIAFDARGQIGLTQFDVGAAEKRVLVQAEIAPGALLRIAFDGPENRARIALVSNGIEYAARDLPRGVVWYEFAPAGPVELRVTSATAAPRTVEFEARPGEVQRVDV